jgi:nucleotide-binding universal stress UspA family protein
METILIPTDFSPPADHAAAYGFKLAEKLKLNIQLCHADKDISTKTSSASKLVSLAGSLVKEKSPSPGDFIPLIKFTTLCGTVASVAQTLTENTSIPMVVMGTSGTGGQQKGFTGRDSQEMIGSSRIPLLLVPPLASTALPRKIAFATDLDEKDMPILYSLATLARDLKAEIIIVHIDAGSYDHETRKGQLHRFLDKVREDIRFTAFSYRNIESKNVAEGLNHIANEGSVDMLVMSHSRHRQLESLLNAGNSFTLEMAKDLRIPLLVFPKDRVASAYPVF